MKANMGTADKWIRVIIAAIIITLFMTKVITGTTGIVLLAVAAIFLFTTVLGFCPIYRLFGISSCKRSE